MQIKAILTKWIENLAALVEAWQVSLQARKSVIATKEDGYFTIRRSASPDSTVLCKLAVGSKMPDGTAEELRKHSVIFEIGADKVVTRRLTLPAQAQEFLPGIVRNQIERLSPWPPAQAVYEITAKPNPADPRTLNVSVSIASSATVDTIRNELAESDLSPTQIAVRTEADGNAPLLTLWKRPAQGGKHHWMDPRRAIIAGLAGMILLSAAISLWAIYSATAISAEHEEVVARSEALQHQSQSPRKLQDIALQKPPQRAWALKENSPVAVMTLEALSRALPDSAYLTELQLENTTLRIIGLAADAPSLIGAIEQSGQFSAVHFFAPTTKAQNNALYRFYIETRVEDHPSFWN